MEEDEVKPILEHKMERTVIEFKWEDNNFIIKLDDRKLMIPPHVARQMAIRIAAVTGLYE